MAENSKYNPQSEIATELSEQRAEENAKTTVEAFAASTGEAGLAEGNAAKRAIVSGAKNASDGVDMA